MAAIALPQDDIHRLRLRVAGISPLLLHRFRLRPHRCCRPTAEPAPPPPRDAAGLFREAQYHDAEGRECVPAIFFKNALVSAARLADDLKMTVLRGALFVEHEQQDTAGLLVLRDSAGRPARSVMHTSTIRIGSRGPVDTRYGARYDDWSVDISLLYRADVLTEERLRALVRLAGFSVGVGDWRPERNGPHGRFDIT
jgi:hypothetical protein